MLNLCKIKKEEEKYTPREGEARPEMWCTRDAQARMSSQTSKRGKCQTNQPPQNVEANSKTTDMLANTALGSNYEMRLGDGSQLYNLTRILL